jgi:hypothetical protein
LREGSHNSVGDLSEISPVAKCIHGVADCRVDSALGEFSDPERDSDSIEEASAHFDGPPTRPLRVGDLGVGSEPTGRPVNTIDLFVENLNGGDQVLDLGDKDFCEATDRSRSVDLMPVLIHGGPWLERRRQLDPVTTGASCCDWTGGLLGGASWPDAETFPDVDDPVGEMFEAGDDVPWVVDEWPGRAWLR